MIARLVASLLVLSLTVTPTGHRRGTEQTFLTFPEWFLVFSPAEYAEMVETAPPSRFPFAAHVGQFWRSYRAVHAETREYPVNTEYHVMILVIGASTTVEYGLRLAYETLVGRLTELTTSYPTTEEDRLAAFVAQDYVDFIRVRPWYEYDFTDKLRRVWTSPWWGDDVLRKWERKYALTTEYGAKAIYGWLIGLGTKASFEAAVPTTAIVVDRLPAAIAATLPGLVVLSTGAGGVLATVPRYQAFTDHAQALARAGVEFREIAGNTSVILVSARVPAAYEPRVAGVRTAFTQPILTRPAEKRVALVIPVGSLSAALRELSVPEVAVEHVFDY